MLDVHPPHEATHTWKDFFIHIATIVVGLLIAVGLEQAVEVAHHHHQRRELVQSLLEDTKRSTLDSEKFQRQIGLRSAWTTQRIAEVRSAIFARQQLAVAAAFPSDNPTVPDSPSWSAAKSSGLLSVLSQDEVRSLGEAANLAIMFEPISEETSVQFANTRRFERHYIVSTTPDVYDYSTATPADLKEYLDLLLTQQTGLRRADAWPRYIRGADAAVLEGSRNIEEVEDSEVRFFSKEEAK